MKLGDTFLNLNPDSPEHLWIVVSHPTESGDVAIVNLTTRRLDSDDTCVVYPGEHPFVQHESVVAYDRAQLVQQQLLTSLEQRGYSRRMQQVSDSLLERIQQGALDSDFTPQKIQAAVRNTVAE